jgi:hypothetical protein
VSVTWDGAVFHISTREIPLRCVRVTSASIREGTVKEKHVLRESFVILSHTTKAAKRYVRPSRRRSSKASADKKDECPWQRAMTRCSHGRENVHQVILATSLTRRTRSDEYVPCLKTTYTSTSSTLAHRFCPLDPWFFGCCCVALSLRKRRNL